MRNSNTNNRGSTLPPSAASASSLAAQQQQQQQQHKQQRMRMRLHKHKHNHKHAGKSRKLFVVSVAVFVAVVLGIEIAMYRHLEETQSQSSSSNDKDGVNIHNGVNHKNRMPMKRKNFNFPGKQSQLQSQSQLQPNGSTSTSAILQTSAQHLPPHLLPVVPILPLFDSVPNAERHVRNLLLQHNAKPTVAGITALLQRFFRDLHKRNQDRIQKGLDGHTAVNDFYEAIQRHLRPFDQKYVYGYNHTDNNTRTNDTHNTSTRTPHLFPLREDGSLFVSIAAFREPLLYDTLVSAFGHARHPEKLFVGVVVQNCFGDVARYNNSTNAMNSTATMYKTMFQNVYKHNDTTGTSNNNNTMYNNNNNDDDDYKPCLTGPVVVGTKPNGKPRRKKLPAPPDANGVALFCADPTYQKYCQQGNVRVLYLHHTDSMGPSMARYYASKLWGGENYFAQIDAHLRFATDWDAKYVAELRATSNYPRSLLSTYPPGFGQIRFVPKHMNINVSAITDATPVIESPGCRLCKCTTPRGEAHPIAHIQQGRNYDGNETRPTQVPFLGAGLVVAHADFLRDVPYDPYLPWTFMGEELLLSMRAWTHGWNIYAPRKNLVVHHYRTGVQGVPKFFGAINSDAKVGFQSKWLQKGPMRRIKHFCGYPNHTRETIEGDGQGIVLMDEEFYGLGVERSWKEYTEFAQLVPNHTTGLLDCGNHIEWCDRGWKV